MTAFVGSVAVLAPMHATPRRIVSFNLCADQLVLALADPEQIAGLSPYAADPTRLGRCADKARAFRALGLAGRDDDPAAARSRPGRPVWDRPLTQAHAGGARLPGGRRSISSAISTPQAQIREVAALLGHPERGEALIAAIDAARGRLAAGGRRRRRRALVVERGGYAAGPAASPRRCWPRRACSRRPARPAGYGGFVPLERLIVLRPGFRGARRPPIGRTTRARCISRPPGVARPLSADAPDRVAAPLYTLCGGPALVAALRLSGRRDDAAGAARALPFGDDGDDRASSPSVSAAGPGCRISGDLISRSEAVAHGGNVREARPRRDLRRHEFLAAPGADDDVGLWPRSRRRPTRCGPWRSCARRQFREHLDAAGGLDQLRHPADAGDHRLVPFLEIDPRPARQLAARARASRSRSASEPRQRVGLVGRADQRAERADHGEDAGEVALVEGVHRDAGGSARPRCRPAGRRTSAPGRA